MPTFSDLDVRVVKMSRALAADAVQQAGNGHPGTAMALAPAAYLLFQRHLRHNPNDANWAGRDRFVLSIGHSSMTLYTQLWLSGYGLELEDLKHFRKAGSLTPGHPEFGHTAGVETTTGPLGQGIGNAVGMALAAKRRAAIAGSGTDLFDTRVYCLAGDGCLQEGVASEAASLAGHLGLDNLILIYDNNHISIDGGTELSFTEDVSARFISYGWEVKSVKKLPNGDIDVEALDVALSEARTANCPVLISMESVIGWPSPKLQGTAKAHGAPLGADEVAATKLELGLDPAVSFYVDAEALEHAREVSQRGAAAAAMWQERYEAWASANPALAARVSELTTLPAEEEISGALPRWEVGSKVATRKAGGAVLNALANVAPALWGGSADLSESNGTLIEDGGVVASGHYVGRNIHFGIREHAMGAILNGLALFGMRPYGGTFLVFSDYMRGAVRLSALMQLPVTYVWTHDSIGLGEDGPTHQPIEHLAALRLIPGFAVVRPADANETAAAWFQLLAAPQPAGLALSRQDLPVVTNADEALTQVAKGGYVLRDAADAQLTLLATGSEVSICVEAAEQLAAGGVNVRVVSMPCVEWFAAQSKEYQTSVLPGELPVLAVEAGASAGWYQYADAVMGIDEFGASAAPSVLFEKFSLTASGVAQRVREVLAATR